jgi:biopolymer transport protein ExbB
MLFTELLAKGGVVMGVLMLMSVYMVAVIGYKLYHFYRLRPHDMRVIAPVIDALDKQREAEALRIARQYSNPASRVITIALQAFGNRHLLPEQRDAAVEAELSHQFRLMRSHIIGLDVVANISPLLGLLGTVVGMVKAFFSIQEVGAKVDPSILAGGIWEALLTTVAGLTVAIPALFAYYYFDHVTESFRLRMREALMEISARS